jgi:hypothetical protein
MKLARRSLLLIALVCLSVSVCAENPFSQGTSYVSVDRAAVPEYTPRTLA